MSGGRYPFISRPIEITAANRVIRITEGASTANVNVAAGTYWIRGDGSADCLLTRLKTALEAATASTNTYTVSLLFEPLNLDTPVVVRIARATGSDTFRLDFDNVAVTFPVEAIGFRRVATALDANDKDGDRPTTGLWMADDMLVVDDPSEDGDVFGDLPASSGAVLFGSHSEPWEMWRWQHARIRRSRTWGIYATYPDVSWQYFHRHVRSGAVCELRTAGISSTAVVPYASASVEQTGGAGAQWVADEQTRANVGPLNRDAPGNPFYSWATTWRRWVAP